jgi:aspartate/glutamate/glutamine transport system ATP-binding protein
MDQGKILEEATPAEFYENPQEERARLFLSRILNH